MRSAHYLQEIKIQRHVEMVCVVNDFVFRDSDVAPREEGNTHLRRELIVAGKIELFPNSHSIAVDGKLNLVEEGDYVVFKIDVVITAAERQFLEQLLLRVN